MKNHQHHPNNSFGQWLKSCEHGHSCLRQWSDRLIELGASWNSFRNIDNDDTLVQDLVNGGIPLLAARNIVRIVTHAMRGNTPMAIFWNLTSMPIPPTMTCRDVAGRLTSALSPHGALVQFRGYESNNGLAGLIRPPQHTHYKHSDLQLSGCQLVDCSPNGCKEAIIVDSMSFAFSHIKGATLCFVVDKAVEDFSYLLATLHCPQWKTIVISKGAMQMHVCDMKMRWETDILQQVYPAITPPQPSTPSLGFAPDDILRLIETEEGVSPTTFDLGIGDAVYTPAKVPPSSELPSLKITSPAATTTSTGVITKAGKGVLKEIIIVSDSGSTPSISLSKKPPLVPVPDKVHQMSAFLPFVLFIARHLCAKAPSKAFITSKSKWSFLLFRTLADVNLAVTNEPHLKQGTLVDWRRLDPLPARSSLSSSQLKKKYTAKGPLEIERTVYCCQCNAGPPRLQTEMIQSPNGEQLYYCSEECYGWGSQEKELAVRNVVALLGVFFANDHVSVQEAMLRNVIFQRYFSSNCTSRRLAKLWITQAVKAGAICLFRKSNTKKNKTVCLKSQYASAELNPLSDDFDTSQEEQHVLDLLWSNNGWVTRIDMVQSLKDRFPQSMKAQHCRSQVIMNALNKESFFVAHGPFGHTVGLTLKDAHAALEIAYPPPPPGMGLSPGTGLPPGMAPPPPPLLQLTWPVEEEENKKPLQVNAPLVNAHTASTKMIRSDLRVVAPFCPKGFNTIEYKKQD